MSESSLSFSSSSPLSFFSVSLPTTTHHHYHHQLQTFPKKIRQEAVVPSLKRKVLPGALKGKGGEKRRQEREKEVKGKRRLGRKERKKEGRKRGTFQWLIQG